MIRFGLIPEFAGRLPVTVNLAPLDKEALIRILTEPRNSLVRQYQKLLKMDGVALEFTPDALEAIAEKAVERGTGARGLRAIMEELMLGVMYTIPSEGAVLACRIDGGAVRGEHEPELVK